MLWNLDKLYESFEDPKLESDLRKAGDMMNTLKGICENDLVSVDDSGVKLEKMLKMLNEFGDLLDNIYSFSYLT